VRFPVHLDSAVSLNHAVSAQRCGFDWARLDSDTPGKSQGFCLEEAGGDPNAMALATPPDPSP
jgi:hypothetical protein